MKFLGIGLALLCCVMVTSGCATQAKAFNIDKFEGVEAETPPENPFDSQPQAGDDSLKAAAVKIVADNSRSSGVNTPYGVLTCWHCVDGKQKISVTCGNESQQATLRCYNAEFDLALLTVEWKEKHPKLNVASWLSHGNLTSVKSVGRGVDGTITVEDHAVSEINRQHEIYTNNPFVEGRSGSALVDGRNEIVGIVRAKDVTTEPYRGLSAGLGMIQPFLTGNARKPPVTPPAAARVAKKKFRAIMWGPSWCTVCINNDWLLEKGNERVAYEHRQGIKDNGDELAFPKEVQAYANGTFPAGSALAGQQRGYPVWQIELEDGSWGFAHHARSFDDLVAIHQLKSGQPIPASTFWKALADRQGQRQMDGLSQVAPKTR